VEETEGKRQRGRDRGKIHTRDKCKETEGNRRRGTDGREQIERKRQRGEMEGKRKIGRYRGEETERRDIGERHKRDGGKETEGNI
jgi:hypothetical protein